ncbi:MAG: hypothetical protein HY848_01600 [Betaproteobacteria bacterium]|nr:hypothetical protein [Betaproteobacteria bacterium]
MTRRRLQLDFIAPPRRPRWLGYALLAVSLVIAADLVVRYTEARLGLERIEAGRDLLNVERRQPPPIPREKLDEQIKNVELIVRQLALPWATLIHTLEDAATKDVAILQLQPDAQQRLLRVTAEARHQEAMLEYLRQLAGAKALLNVHLVSHQVQLDDPQRPIQFSVQASFTGAP